MAFGLTVGLGFGLGVVVEPWILGLAWAFHLVGHRFAVSLRWVLGFGLSVVVEPWVLGLAWAFHPVGHRFAVGLRWVLGFGSRRGGGPWVCRGFGFVCRGSWESIVKKKIKMRREKSEMRRERKKKLK